MLLFFHGGGYCSGSIVSHRRMETEAGRAARCAHAGGAIPACAEHPYPHEERDEGMAFPARPGIAARDIAGAARRGNLTLINRLRAAGEEQPACAWLADQPDDVGRFAGDRATAMDPLIHKAYLEELADTYAPKPIDRMDPLISPLFADLTGFPPVLIQVGSAETLK